jgi:hypothetical protein
MAALQDAAQHVKDIWDGAAQTAGQSLRWLPFLSRATESRRGSVRRRLVHWRAAPARGRPSALIDTRVIYCGLRRCSEANNASRGATHQEQLRKLPDACVDLIYASAPFNSNRNYKAFWGETNQKRASSSKI